MQLQVSLRFLSSRRSFRVSTSSMLPCISCVAGRSGTGERFRCFILDVSEALEGYLFFWGGGGAVERRGARDGAVVRALAPYQCGPGSNPGVDAICGLSLLLVLSIAPSGFCPGAPVPPSPQKPTFPNSNSTKNQVDEEPFYGCATSKSLFIYLFILFYLYLFS